MAFILKDLIDIEQFQMLQDRLNEIYSFPSAIIDNEGNILTATAWQDVCIKFHRVNKKSAAECTKSDQYILSHLHEANPAVTYRCPHGLVDNATPIIIEGVHYGNFFTGQFFLEKPDMGFFKAQAKKYGFDETTYLEAVKKVPVWTTEQLNNYLFFIKGLIKVISGIGLKNLREIEARKLIKEKEEQARTILSHMFDGYWILNMQGKILDVNEALCRMLGYTREEMLMLSLEDVVEDESPEIIANRRQDIIRKGSSYFEAKFRRKDGSILIIEVALRHLPDRELIIGFHRDITARKEAEKARRDSEALLNTILDNVGAYIFIKDTQYRYTYVNRKVCELFGRKPEDILGYSDDKFFSPESVEEIMRSDRPVIEQGVTASREETDLRSSDKVPRTYWTVKLPLRDSHGSIISLCGISTDISEKKRTEDLIKASLKEKETLLRELSHRTRNNMQVISSLIKLQSSTLSDPQLLNIFMDTESRIRAMALVHEKLYKTGGFTNIDIKSYMSDLTNSLLSGYLKSPGQISLVLDVEDIRMSIDTAIPCGLIINELMTNALKYAFPENRRGEIRLAMHSTDTGEIEMRFNDNGIGLPEGFDIRNTKTMGLMIATSLAKDQLNGEMSVAVNRGTEYIVRFRELKASEVKI